MTRLRLFLHALAAGLVLVTAQAQAAFPDRPIRLIVGFAPGGGTDILARQLAQYLTDKWGKGVVVDNRPGGNGTIANELVAHAAPDGYTILFTPGDFTVMPSVVKLNYDPIKGFAPVILLASFPDAVLVNPTSPVNTLQELVDLAKAKPGSLNFGSSGIGSIPSLDTFRMLDRAGVTMTHVPYKGTGPATTALMGGEIQLLFGSLSSSLPLIKAGNVKALAITSKSRSPLLPDVPTVAEALNLPGYVGENWYAVLAPAGTPKEIVDKLHDGFLEALKAPVVQRGLASQGVVTIGAPPAELAQVIAQDIAKWGEVVKKIEAK